MVYFRKTWPNENISPKMHMLEDHVTDFIKQWGLGLGIYNEQGGESIHAEYNILKKQFSSIPNSAQRLKYTMKEHYIKSHPVAQTIAKRAHPKPRKLEENNSS